MFFSNAHKNTTPAPCSGTLQLQRSPRAHDSSTLTAALQRHLKAAFCSGTLQRHQQPSFKAQTKQHPAAAHCSGASNQAPKSKQNSDRHGSTLQRRPTAPCIGQQHPPAAPCNTLQRHQPSPTAQTAPPCSGTLQRCRQPSSKTQTCNSSYT